VELGVKNSTVQSMVPLCDDKRVILLPTVLPFPTGNLKPSPELTFLVNGPSTYDDAEPPAGFTQLIAVFTMLSLLVEVVIIRPLVRFRLPPTSTWPFAPMERLLELFMVKWLNLFVPVKLPVVPPRV